MQNVFSRCGNLWLFLGIVPLLLMNSPASWASERAQNILALVDYIGGDYRNAVQGGQVLNSGEYQEMTEFSTRSLELFEQLKGEDGDKAGIERDLHVLGEHIKNKSGDEAVPRLAQEIKARLIKAYNISTHPRAIPNYDSARVTYVQNCAQCHGESGRGDGPAVATMQPKEPKPANFLDVGLINNLSPFKAFNTATFGIQGTAMPNFSALSEEQRWEAAFYVFALRFSAEDAAAGRRLFAAREKLARLASPDILAAATDGELAEKLGAELSKDDAIKGLAYLRNGLLRQRTSAPLFMARTYLKEAMNLYEEGDTPAAYQRSVDAYLDGFELAEPALFSKNASLGRELEARFAELRGALRSGNRDRVRDLYARLDAGLIQAIEVLGRQVAESRTYTFFNSALIIVREGLEAALIVAAILAALKAMGASQAIRYVHLGWVLAVISGIATWLLAQTAVTVSGAQREVVEGLSALLAATVLFFVSCWLISKAEARRWQLYIQARVHEALTGRRLLALMSVSFLAVYREAFETVLFYQALWLQSVDTQLFVIWGLLAGVGLVGGLVYGIFTLGLKIPLRMFFGVSSALLYLLAFVFVGKGIKALQAAGWFSEVPLSSMPQLPLLGIYPTVETTLAQGAMIVAPIVALLWLWKAAPGRVKVGQA